MWKPSTPCIQKQLKTSCWQAILTLSWMQSTTSTPKWRCWLPAIDEASQCSALLVQVIHSFAASDSDCHINSCACVLREAYSPDVSVHITDMLSPLPKLVRPVCWQVYARCSEHAVEAALAASWFAIIAVVNTDAWLCPQLRLRLECTCPSLCMGLFTPCPSYCIGLHAAWHRCACSSPSCSKGLFPVYLSCDIGLHKVCPSICRLICRLASCST